MDLSTVQRDVKKRAKKARTVSLYRPLGWGHTPIRCEISIGLPLVQNNLLTIQIVKTTMSTFNHKGSSSKTMN